MRLLLDTNILVRLISISDPAHSKIKSAIQQRLDKDLLVLSPQCLYEFWTVVTRPASSNGYGLSPSEAGVELRLLTELFDVQDVPTNEWSTWLSLCERYAIKGKASHDAHLVAFMICHGIEGILTLNPNDFRRYSEIQVMEP